MAIKIMTIPGNEAKWIPGTGPIPGVMCFMFTSHRHIPIRGRRTGSNDSGLGVCVVITLNRSSCPRTASHPVSRPGSSYIPNGF